LARRRRARNTDEDEATDRLRDGLCKTIHAQIDVLGNPSNAVPIDQP
jgi:hypothetical protein